MAASKLTRKQLRIQVMRILASNFAGISEQVGTKKFKENIKNASKELLRGVKVKQKKK